MRPQGGSRVRIQADAGLEDSLKIDPLQSIFSPSALTNGVQSATSSTASVARNS